MTLDELELYKKEKLDKVPDFDKIQLMGNQVLVLLYMRPETTKGGLIISDGVRNEDKFQGKTGVIMKMGPAAFVDDSMTSFYGVDPKVNDWVLFRPSDGLPINFCDWANPYGHDFVSFRMFQDVQIKAIIPEPAMVH